ncbi:MAG: contractile injection system tape measure protein [Saprospiraceae bacterium]
MSNRHLIGKETIELRLNRHQQAYALQEQFSQFHWRLIVPALEQLFDRLVGEDILLRLDKLEIDLGEITEQDLLSTEMIDLLVQQLEEAITVELQRPSPQSVLVKPMTNLFKQWLFFLEHGYLPFHACLPVSSSIWQKAIFESLALEEKAVIDLHLLLSRRPMAFERLLLQYDNSFLQKIVELNTGYPQEKLRQTIEALAKLVASLVKEIKGIQKKNEDLEINETESTENIQQQKQVEGGQQRVAESYREWETLFGPKIEDYISHTLRPILQTLFQNKVIAATDFSNKTLIKKRITSILHSRWATRTKLSDNQIIHQMEREAWAIVLNETVLHRNKRTVEQLIAIIVKQQKIIASLPLIAGILSEKEFGHEALGVLPETEALSLPLLQKLIAEKEEENTFVSQTLQEAHPKPSEPIPFTQQEDAFFILNAGMVLLHPFLVHFFKKLGLIEGKDFRDDLSCQKAICLLHFLATGEIKPPEYILVLPKFLCGLPLNSPVDNSIILTKEELEEAENMMQAAIEHWEALGTVSIDGLREGFLQRDGKLEKRQTGWTLLVERQVLDILIDRLPWTISMIKLPWMQEPLRIEWTK